VPSDDSIALRSSPLWRKHPTGSPPPGFAFQWHRHFHVQPHDISYRLLSGHPLHFAQVRALQMSWGTPNVSEQRARFMARPASGSPPGPPPRHFLIADLELKFNLSYIRISDLKFSNCKKPRLFRQRRLSAISHFPSTKRPNPSLVIPAPLQVKLLIETPRLKIHVTSRKQNQSQFLIETNQALSGAGSSLHGLLAAPASPQATPPSATALRPFPPLC
jgi:hypothetical protein